jgi:putative hemolysin
LDTEIITSIVIIAGLLIFSGFFSGSEVAFFSLNVNKLKRHSSKQKKADERVITLLERPRKLLITILISNTVVNVGIAITAAVLALRLADILGINPAILLTLEVILITLCILIFSEVTPKVLATKMPIEFARFASLPLTYFFTLLYPVSEIFAAIARFIQRIVRVDKLRSAISADELKTLAEVGMEHGSLEHDESRIIQGVADFGDTTVREIMGSRVDMIMLQADSTVQEAMELIRESGHSRIPIYEEHPDDIKGILYAKDLLPFLVRGKKKSKTSLKSLVREALFVPESKPVEDLLHEFQAKKTHIALVVDEYGGVSGLVTLEDIIEEIVGDIRDEHDKEIPYYKKIREREYLINPTIGIHEIEELTGLSFTREDVDYDTLGGFLITHFGKIPEKGQRYTYLGLEFIIERVRNRRITRVRLIDKREFPTEITENT